MQHTNNTLKRIHNIKRKNKQLSDKRYQQYLIMRKYDSTTLGFSMALVEFARFSEIIGGNGIKIQKLRSDIKNLQQDYEVI